MMGYWFLVVAGVYGINFWLPTLVKNVAGGGNETVGLWSAIPYVGCAVGMVLFCTVAERTCRTLPVLVLGTILGGNILDIPVGFTQNRKLMWNIMSLREPRILESQWRTLCMAQINVQVVDGQAGNVALNAF